MAHHKSALKRIRQTAKRNARNRSQRSTLRTALKKFRAQLEQNDLDGAEKALPSVHKAIDKAVTKGIVHGNTASRTKSRVTRALARARAA